jgi:dihydroxy-acid dehydratase
MMIGHVSPEAAAGGPLALVRNGDAIAIDASSGLLALRISKAEMAKRRKSWKPRKPAAAHGVLEKYADQVGSAHLGAVTHSGPGRARK